MAPSRPRDGCWPTTFPSRSAPAGSSWRVPMAAGRNFSPTAISRLRLAVVVARRHAPGHVLRPGHGDHRRSDRRGRATTLEDCWAGDPTWSPVTHRIAASVNCDSGAGRSIYTLRPDGSDLQQVTADHNPDDTTQVRDGAPHAPARSHASRPSGRATSSRSAGPAPTTPPARTSRGWWPSTPRTRPWYPAGYVSSPWRDARRCAGNHPRIRGSCRSLGVVGRPRAGITRAYAGVVGLATVSGWPRTRSWTRSARWGSARARCRPVG